MVDADSDEISYSIVITNTGNLSLTNVVMSDPLLSGANGTLVSTPTESVSTDSILTVGETFTYTGTYTVQQSDIDDNGGGDGDIDNVASVVSSEITTPITSEVDTPISQLPAYTILKTVTDVGGDGVSGVVDADSDEISYSIVITNTGNLSLTNVVMSDPLLSGANGTLVSTPTESVSTDSILAVGETFTYTGTYTVQQSDIDDNGGGDGDIDNVASVVSAEITTPQSSTTETPVTQLPGYTILKTVTDVGGDGASGAIDAAGDEISYSIVITNTGNLSITNVVMSDPLLSGTNGTLVSTPTESVSTDSILAVGETFTYTGTYTVQQSDIDDNGGGDGDIDNVASVVSSEITTPITSEVDTPISQLPAYTILKTVTDVGGDGASGSIDAAGDEISYSIVITNTGNLSLTNVVMSDPLLSGANGTLVSTPTESISTDSILAVGETFTYTGTYTVQQSDIDDNGGGDGDIDNVASVVSSEITTPITSEVDTPISQLPAYTILKTVTDVGGDGASGSIDAAGDEISYSIVITNTGNLSLTNVVMSDPLLSGTNGTLVSTPTESVSTDSILAVGETFTYTGTYTVQQSDIDDNGGGDGDIDNVASVVNTEITTPQISSTETPVSQLPAYTIVKTVIDVGGEGASGVVDAAGDVISYSIIVTNTGNVSITNVVMSDPLLSGANGTLNTTPLESLSTDSILAVGETFTYTGTYTAQQSDIDDNGSGDGDVDNTASVVSSEIIVPTTSETETPVDQLPAYTIVKTVTDVGGDGPDGFINAAGDAVSYSIVVANTGNQTITGVVLTDALLSGANGTLTSVPNESITADGILDVGETFTYTGTYTAQQSDIDDNGGGDGDLDNVAFVVSAEIITPQTSKTDTPVTQKPLYTIVKTVTDVDGDGESGVVDAAGDVISYSIVVTNTGNQSLTGVVLADPLLSGPNSSLGTVPAESLNVNSILEVGETFSYTGTYIAQQSDVDNNGGGDGDIDNTATVVSVEIPASLGSSTDTPVIQNPGYSISKTVTDVGGDGPLGVVNEIGDTVTYQIVVANTGNMTLTGVGVSDPLLTSTHGTLGTVAESGLVNSLLDVGETWTYVGSYVVPQVDLDTYGGGDGLLENTATVESSELPDQSDTVSVELDVSDLGLEKSFTYLDVDGSQNLSGGDEVTFRLSLLNQGPDVATNVSVSDALNPGYTFLSFSGDGSYDSGSGVWSAGDVAVAEIVNLDVVVSINAGFDPAAGDYANYAEILSSDQHDPDSIPGDASDGADDDDSVEPLIADLAVTKVVSNAAPRVGETVTFSITVTNSGPDDASSVSIADVLPSGYTAITNASDSGGVTSGGVDWTGLAIVAGESKVLTFDAEVVGAFAGVVYNNSVEITGSDQFDPDSTPDPAPDADAPSEDDEFTTEVIPLGDLSGLIFWDVDADGLQETGQPQVNGLTVNLYKDVDGDGIQEPGGDDGAPLAVTLTADDPSGNPGHYSFVDLVTDTYFVEFDPTPAMTLSAVNVGVDDGVDSDADPNTGLTGLRAVLPGGSVTAVDAGIHGLGEIGDRIWHDVNRDGLQTTDEPAMNGIQLELIWPGPDGIEGTSDDISLFTVTEPGVTPDGQQGGTYSFPNLFEGDYRIVATQPLGSVPTFDEDGGNDNTASVSVSAGDSLTTLDFGFTGTGGLSGFVIIDMDRSKSVSERDLGIGGTTILLTGVDIYGGNVVRETTTNSIGFYEFADLLPGNYELVELQPGDFVDNDDFTGDLGGAVGGNDRFESVVVDVDQFGTLYNFTESIAPSMVSKRLFLGNATGSLFAIPGTQRLNNYDLQDPVSAADVYGDTNADGLVTALDALRVLNSLQRFGGSGARGAEGEGSATIAQSTHLDVNRDGVVTTIDALSVLNALSKQSATEGEFRPIREAVWEQSADQFMANHEQDEEENDALLELLALEASRNQG